MSLQRLLTASTALTVLTGLAAGRAVVPGPDPSAGDPVVEFTLAATSIDENGGAEAVAVTLSAVSATDVTIPFTIGGSAAAADATVAASPLIIPAGQTQGTIQVDALDDGDAEGTERVTLTLGTPTGGTLGARTVHDVVLLDDEPAATIEFAAGSLSVVEGIGTATVDVVLSAPRTEEARVSFTQSGTASPSGVDVLVTPASPVVFAPQATTATVSFAVTPDVVDEVDETLTLQLLVPINGMLGTQTTFTLTLEDDDAPPTVSFGAASGTMVEFDALTTVDVELSAPSSFDVSVPITASGTATVPDDVTYAPATVDILAGETVATVDIAPVDDTDAEGAETLTLTLGTPTNATVGGQATFELLLVDDDDAPPSVAFDLPSSSVDETGGSVFLTVTADGYAPFPILVPVGDAGSATPGNDYDLVTPNLTIPVGSLTAQVEVLVLDDGDFEGDEDVTLALGTPTGASLGSPAAHTLTIVDDENGTPIVNVVATDDTATEGGADTTIEFTVSLDIPAPADVTVPFVLSGTASEGVDYSVSPASPLVLPTGASTAVVTLTVLDEGTLYEGPETVVLDLGAPTGADLGTSITASGTVEEGDPQPTVEFPAYRFVVDEAVGTYDLEFVLSEPAAVDVEVPFVVRGPAASPNDISFPASPLVVPAGQSSAFLPITVIADTEHEPGEPVLFTIGTPLNAGVGTIDSHVLLIQEVDDFGGGVALPDPLVASTATLDFPQTRVGEASAPQTVHYTNVTPNDIVLTAVDVLGAQPSDFTATAVGGLPVTVAPGQAAAVEVRFTPTVIGQRVARIRATQQLQGAAPQQIGAFGRAIGPVGDELRLTASNLPFTSSTGEYWAPEWGASKGQLVTYTDPIAGTNDDGLYQTLRFDDFFTYNLELPNGAYEVRIHGWEPVKGAPGQRLMDVTLEGVLALDDLDIYAEVGRGAAYVSPALPTTVIDGQLDIHFDGVVAFALVSAIEVRSVPVLSSPTAALYFGNIDQGTSSTLDVEVVNDGLAPAVIDQVTFELGPLGDSRDFSTTDGGTAFAGGQTTVSHATSIAIAPGSNLIPVTFTPTFHEDHDFTLRLEASATGDVFEVNVVGTGAAEAGWGFLHPVPDSYPTYVVDYDGDGLETVQLLGAESHTHEPGHALALHEWTVGGVAHSTDVDTEATFPLGATEIELAIHDDNVPANIASDTRTITVHPVDGVPGVLAEYYDAATGDEIAWLDAVPPTPDFIERRTLLSVPEMAGSVGASPFTAKVLVVLKGRFELQAARSLEFVATGGNGHRILVDGTPATVPVGLAAGTHSLEVRFAVTDSGDLPVSLTILENGSTASDVLASIKHDEQSVLPVIHQMPTVGTDLGGNRITIEGFGFFPKDSVTIHWGTVDIDSSQFEEWIGEAITITTPPGSGVVPVSVETPNGISNAVDWTYSPTGPIPVRFDVLTNKEVTLANVTTAAWGPDGKLYVGVLDGTLRVLSFDDDWDITSIGFKLGVSGLTNADLMGIAFNPYDDYDPQDPTSLKVYVSHGEQFQNGGGAFTGPSYYTGQVSMLQGPNFDAPVPVVSQLPVSNYDHAINGIFFDDNGDLMICSGGNTNGGVKAPLLGDVPESPLSGAILRARTSDPNFDGLCLYVDSSSGVFVDDQVYGEQVDLAPGVGVEVYASGFRNSWDMVLHTNGYIYGTENGPNLGYGAASLDMTTDTGSLPTKPDELNLIEKGNYYGGANRARGRYDARQAVYHSPFDASIAEEYTAPITTLDSSTNGIVEYRATAFNSEMRGELVAMKWNFGIYRIELTDHGRRVQSKTLYQSNSNPAFMPNRGLDVVYAPGGALVAIDYSTGKVRVQVPNDIAAIGPTPYDITPWRVPAGGGQPFVIGGTDFGNDLGAVSVTIDGVAATVTSVSDTRIRGIFPPSLSGGATGMLDVVVQVGTAVRTIPEAMRYLPANPGEAVGTWFDDSVLPLALGEVSTTVLDGKLYVFGQGDARTMRRDLLNPSWNLNLAQRPFPGNHHGLEVVGGKIYLIGGLDNGAAGKVQIYDPQTDLWTLGAPMPWDGGSCATALIDGLIYVGGGNLQTGGTAGNFAVYDPALDTWTSLGAMPTPVNHAAAGTDGSRMYVFGGRQGNNVPQPGFDDVQVYDPVTDTWETSDAGDVAAMPLPRGGTGRAVWLDGAFWILGGEDATIAYGDVQAYDPVTDTWRTDAPMKTPRHGIFPTVFQGRIYVLGGGLAAGYGVSAVSEVLAPR